ncbi:hypothetical protein ACGFIR_01355 [Micromonospora sp. NPDC049051]|uniref:hypothetical protein n=1 Tax=Micromonospora sp. NPDC049051 TaxID=3364264 RepID=UPI00371102C4
MDAVVDDDSMRELRRVRERVDRLENALLRLVSLIAAALVVVGLLLPYAAFDEQDELYDESMLTIGFTAGAADAFFAVTFLPLLVVAGATLLFLALIGKQSAGRTGERLGVVVGWLVLLSAAGAGLLAIVPSGDGWDAGPGAWVYAAGAALAFVVLGTEQGRDFWVAERRGKIRP